MVIGITQPLRVEEVTRDGYQLTDGEGSVLLPYRNAPDPFEVGDTVRVFLYSDKEGEPLATTQQPFLERNRFGLLEVVDVSRHGLHLDWGLERDLFVPFNLQHERLSAGDRVVVTVDVDDQNRVFGSHKLVDYLDDNLDGLENEQEVALLVYGFNSYGALVVVNQRYTGIVYRNETFQTIRLGDELTGYIKCLRHDGKIDVSLQRNKKAGILDAADVIWERLNRKQGFLALNDKSDPTHIRRELALSKKQFKKGVGSLYRQRRIAFEDGGIRMVSEPDDNAE